MAGSTDAWRLAPSRVILSPGATLAQLIGATAGQVGLFLKGSAGFSGVCEILGVSYGLGVSGYMPMSAADLATSNGTGYRLDPSATKPLYFRGAPWFMLSATGATIVVDVIREMGAGS